jgi:hypothetical protein
LEAKATEKVPICPLKSPQFTSPTNSPTTNGGGELDGNREDNIDFLGMGTAK